MVLGNCIAPDLSIDGPAFFLFNLEVTRNGKEEACEEAWENPDADARQEGLLIHL